MRNATLFLLFAAGALVTACSSSDPATATGGDASISCAPPAGYECCDGDVSGTYSCDAKGNVVCQQGTRITPSKECTAPGPLDAGHDAGDAGHCAPPAGFECCDGDVLGTASCGADGGVVCSAGTRLTPSKDCSLPPPFDAGPDSSDASSDAPDDAAHD